MSALTRSKARGLRSLLPTHPFGLLSHEFDDLINRFGESWGDEWPLAERIPSLDLTESNGTLEAKMDVPGMSPDEIEIEVNGDTLTISGEHKEETKEEDKEKKFHRVERRSGSFRRSVSLPCSVKESEVSAEYKDGVLTITMPKTENARSHRVSIKS